MGAMLVVTGLTVTSYANSVTYEITGKDSAHTTTFTIIKEEDEGTENRRSGSVTKLRISNYRAYDAETGSPLRAELDTDEEGLPGTLVYFDKPVSQGYRYWIEEDWQSPDLISQKDGYLAFPGQVFGTGILLVLFYQSSMNLSLATNRSLNSNR